MKLRETTQWRNVMGQLTRGDFEQALELVQRVAEASTTVALFGETGVQAVSELIASDLTTLSICNLRTGHREVIGLPGQRLSRSDIEAFDRHFFTHPLVRYHGFEGGHLPQRISDSLSAREFRGSDLYNEYYRKIGIHHAMAVPVEVAQGNLVSFVLNRSSRDFTDRDRARADLVRPILSSLYKRACASTRLQLLDERSEEPEGSRETCPGISPKRPESVLNSLTRRERDVLRYVALGKTDHDVASLLVISRRTVQKHLEHIYIKLGVETRTAAAMRLVWEAVRSP
jgi:DNA-binding CsgD family transcriptional regulator